MEVRPYHVHSLLLSVPSRPQNCFHDLVNAQYNSLHILLSYEDKSISMQLADFVKYKLEKLCFLQNNYNLTKKRIKFSKRK